MSDHPRTVPAEAVVRCLGRQLKILREQARLTRAELGGRLGYSPHTVAALEQGRRTPQPDFLTAADTALGASGLLDAAADLITATQIAHFPTGPLPTGPATAWHAYDTTAVHPLLHTPDYARALLHAARPLLDEEAVERHLAAQTARHEDLLTRRTLSHASFVIEEAALHRPHGGRPVLRAQLHHLLEVARLRHVEIQVLPTALTDHPATGGPFALLEPADGHPPVVCTGGHTLTRRTDVRPWQQRHTALRAQALSPARSLALIEELAGRTD